MKKMYGIFVMKKGINVAYITSSLIFAAVGQTFHLASETLGVGVLAATDIIR